MISRRWLWLLLLIPVAIGLARLRFDVEVLNLLPDDLPAVQGLRLHQEYFPDARDLIITVSAEDADTASAAARALAEHLRLATNLVRGASWQPPWLEHPEQSAEFIAYLWLNQPPAEVRALATRLAPANRQATLAATRAALTTSMSPEEIGRRGYDPYGLMALPGSDNQSAQFGQGDELFASTDGTFRLLFVQARDELRTYQQCAAWLSGIRAHVVQWQQTDELADISSLRFTGHPAFLAEISGSMERDMKSSILGTAGIVAVLFWLAHRRFKPLVWLITLLAVVLVSTLGVGGLLFGSLNVVSLGFAAILLGLGVDYALVLYQEALAAPGKSAAEIRRGAGSSIFWASLTTAAAFLVLNWGGLPGLAQLGTLVTVGVLIAAFVMSYLFLPPLLRKVDPRETPAQISMPHREPNTVYTWVGTFVLLGAAVLILSRGMPAIDASADPLRPLNSDAYFAMEELQQRFQRTEPVYLMLQATSEETIARRLGELERFLSSASLQGQIAEFTLPENLWAKPEYQAANQSILKSISADKSGLHAVATDSGFSTDAMRVTDSMLATWEKAGSQPGTYWPTNSVSRWILNKVAARHGDNWFALGLVIPNRPGDMEWAKGLPAENLLVTGWGILGESVFSVVKRDLWFVLIPMAVLITTALWCAFRSWREVILSLATLAFSFVLMLAIMKLAGWEWNLMNLMALPLLLGMAEDYSIHMQHSLHRHSGNIAEARRVTGRAIALCAATTISGFGSLALSSNAGLASLGRVCSAGIACACFIALYLLPGWWKSFGSHASINRPSSLYRTRLWKAGMALTRTLPEGCINAMAKLAGLAYWLIGGARRRVVIENLLPIARERKTATRLSRQLYQQFGQKVVDLWRFESGVPPKFGKLLGWENFLAARGKDRGALFLTPHLGNWEFGGPIMTDKKVKLHVITLTEPDPGLTELRQASRARWGIETVVIGNDPFAFVEIVKLLQGGASIALLIDRPVEASAVTVELFGKPFPASIAAAELARASGCALVPSVIVWNGERYDAQILPEITYDRAALNTREARIELTRQIVRVFEPLIGQHADQWYHFVPVWTTTKLK